MRRPDPRPGRALRAIALAAALLGAPVAVAGTNGAASAEYARQVSAATLRVAQLESELAKSQQRIEQLEEVIRLQGQSEASRLENVDQVNAEIAKLRGENEVFTFQVEDLKKAIADLQVGYERRHLHAEKRLANLESFLGVKPPPPPTDAELGLTTSGAGGPGTPTVATDTPTEEMPATAMGKLDAAVAHMEAGRQGAARAVLQRAIGDHPRAPEIPEIRYRYAETFLNEGKLRPAILEFKKVTDNHPGTEWACWSYYRQGEAMEKLSGLDEARLFYSGATDGACKSSEAAKQAKKKL